MQITSPAEEISGFADTDSYLWIYQNTLANFCYCFSYKISIPGTSLELIRRTGGKTLVLNCPVYLLGKKKSPLHSQRHSHDTTVWC